MEAVVKIDDARVREAFRKAPGEMAKALRRYVSRAGSEVAREMKRTVPKAFSTLVSAINAKLDTGLVTRIAAAGAVSSVITAGTNYARVVEEGGGPGGRVPLSRILDWIRVKKITPRDPDDTERYLAFLIQRSILAKGTPKQPYAAPSLEKKRSRIFSLIDQAVNEGLRNAGLA